MPAINYDTEAELASLLAEQVADILETVDPQQYWQLASSSVDEEILENYADMVSFDDGLSDSTGLDGDVDVVRIKNVLDMNSDRGSDFIEQLSNWILKDSRAFEQLRFYFGGYSEPFEIEPEFHEVEAEVRTLMKDFNDFINKRAERIVARYRCNYMDNPSEIENIATKFENGAYYNHYMFDDERDKGAHRTGPFRTEAEAKADVQKNRPKAWSVSNILTFTMPVEPAVSFIVKERHWNGNQPVEQSVRCSTVGEAIKTYQDLSNNQTFGHVRTISISLIDKDNEGVMGVPVVEKGKVIDNQLRENRSYYSNPTVVKAFNELNKGISPILKAESKTRSETTKVIDKAHGDAVYKKINNIRVDQIAYTLNPDMMADARVGKSSVEECMKHQNQVRKSVEKSLGKLHYPNGFLIQVTTKHTDVAHNKRKTKNKAYVIESDNLKDALDSACQQMNCETVYTGKTDLAVSGYSTQDNSSIRITIRAFNENASQETKDAIPRIIAHGTPCYKFISKSTATVVNDVRRALHIPTIEAEHSAISKLHNKKKEVQPTSKDNKDKSNDEHNGR